jgi:hypothetical protein
MWLMTSLSHVECNEYLSGFESSMVGKNSYGADPASFHTIQKNLAKFIKIWPKMVTEFGQFSPKCGPV